ncbi:MAG: leucine-rich repeat domain-containing protein [Eubacterium sp.]
MARINIDKRILDNVKQDDIAAVLNQLIDDELAKDVDKIDTDFVDECVNALLEIEQQEDDKFRVLVPLMSSEKFLKKISSTGFSFKRLNTFAKTAVIAAVIAGSTYTANAAVAAVTGVDILGNVGDAIQEKFEDWGLIKGGIEQIEGEDDDDEIVTTTAKPTKPTKPTKPSEPTKPSKPTSKHTTTAAQSTTNQTTKQGIEQIEGEDDDDTTTATKPTTTKRSAPNTTVKPITEPDKPQEPDKPYLTAHEAEFDNFKVDYIYGEELDYSGLTLTRVYSDGARKPLSLSECDYTQSVNMNTTANYTLRIIYETCVVTVDITVRPDEDTRGSEICKTGIYDYLLTDNGAYITKYRGNDTEINLDEVDGNPVFAIGEGVFKNSDVTRITAQNVRKIFPSAFENSADLTECYTPLAEYVGDYAFAGCAKLDEAVFGEGLYKLGKGAYKNTAVEQLVIGQFVREIPDELCKECPNLKKVELLGEVTEIGADAFSDCTALELVTGTKNLVKIGAFAFDNDESVDFDSFPRKLESVGENAFNFCRNLNIGTLPDTIKEIGDMSFAYCSKLTSITIQNGITVIPYGCFRATGATEITLSEGVEEIKGYAFMSTMPKQINLPVSLEKIDTYALYSVTLRDVHFAGKLISSISNNAFYPGKRVTFYVYNGTIPMEYAEKNNIAYEIIKEEYKHPLEDDNPDNDRIEHIQGEDD